VRLSVYTNIQNMPGWSEMANVSNGCPHRLPHFMPTSQPERQLSLDPAYELGINSVSPQRPAGWRTIYGRHTRTTFWILARTVIRKQGDMTPRSPMVKARQIASPNQAPVSRSIAVMMVRRSVGGFYPRLNREQPELSLSLNITFSILKHCSYSLRLERPSTSAGSNNASLSTRQ